MVANVVQGQSREQGKNDGAMIRDVARVLRALLFAAVTRDEALGEIAAVARAYLLREHVKGACVTEDGTRLALDDDTTTRFACGGDIEVERPDALRELHTAMMGWLEGGASGPASPDDVARWTCFRVNSVPSPLREMARRNGHDLRSAEEARGLADEFIRIRKRKDAPKEWWRLAQRLLTRAAIRWGMPEAEAFKLFDFQRKASAKLDGRPRDS